MENIRITTNPLYQSQNTVNNNISTGYDKLNNIPKSLNNNIYDRLKPISLETYGSTLEGVYQDLNTIDNLKKYKLPDDWIKLYDKETGKYYYACLTTKHTQWLHPSIPIGTMMENGLPYGWDCNIDPETNEKYYINHVGRFTTWNPPVKQRKYKGNDYIWEVEL